MVAPCALSFVVFYFSAARLLLSIVIGIVLIDIGLQGTYFKSNKVFNHARSRNRIPFLSFNFFRNSGWVPPLDCFVWQFGGWQSVAGCLLSFLAFSVYAFAVNLQQNG
jgi:hypothetical protein